MSKLNEYFLVSRNLCLFMFTKRFNLLTQYRGRLARWRACDVGEAKEGLENELWRRWSDVRIGELGSASPTLQLILQTSRRFIYATAHSITLPPLHVRHRSFYNPFVVSPTSQALHVLHLASRQCIGGWKNSVCWTSLLQQVTKFRSSYSFG